MDRLHHTCMTPSILRESILLDSLCMRLCGDIMRLNRILAQVYEFPMTATPIIIAMAEIEKDYTTSIVISIAVEHLFVFLSSGVPELSTTMSH